MKKHARNFSSQICLFYLFFMFPHRWIIQNQSNLSEENNFQWFFFSRIHYLLFYLRSSVPPLITMSFKKNSWKTVFKKSIYSEKESFFSKFLCKPIGRFYRNFPKNFYECNFFWRKKILRRMFFFHLTLALRSPTKNNVIQNIFLKKNIFSGKVLNIKHIFCVHHLSCVPLLIVCTKPIKNFYMKCFLWKNFSKIKNFLSIIGLL